MRPRMTFLLAFFASLAAGATATAADTLNMAVSTTPLSLPLYVAQEKGYFAAEDLEVKLTDCIGGYRCLRKVIDGLADVATAAELPVVLNSFDRTDYAIIGTIVSTSDDVKLIANTRTGITTPAQLTGKRIGVVTGSSGQYFLDLFLLTVGLDPRALNIVGLTPEEMVVALRSGKVDAIAIWEPYGYLAVKALGGSGLVLPNASVYIETFNLIASRRLFGSRDVALARLLRAVERAEQFIHQYPDDAKAILRKRLQLDQASVDWVWRGLAFRLALEQSLVSTMESQARWALREGHVKGKTSPNVLTLLYAAPLGSIKPAAVHLLR